MLRSASYVVLMMCTALGTRPALGADITLYSHRHYESDDALFKRFTEKTGIGVNVVKAKADELIERLKAEGEQTKADVLMTADAGSGQLLVWVRAAGADHCLR
jgi:iron(III) transport system substrate-binding protein